MEKILKQQSFLKGKVELQLEKDGLSYKNIGLFSSQKFFIPYERINKDPIAVKKIAWSWLVAIFILGLAVTPALLGLATGNVSEKEHDGSVGFSIVGLTLIAIMAVQCFRQSHNLLIFLEERTGASLFSLRPATPNQEEVETFCAEIAKQINRIRYPSDMSTDQRAEVYKKHLEFLLSEGVITEVEFSSIFERVVSKQGSNVVQLVRN